MATTLQAYIASLAAASGTLDADDVFPALEDGVLVKATPLEAAATALPFVDVRRFGAVGDGVTDDTAAIQAALDEAGTTPGVDPGPGEGGVEVVFPPGTFVAAGLESPPNVKIRGAGAWATRILAPTGTAETFVLKTWAWAVVSDLTIDGGSEAVVDLFVAGARTYLSRLYIMNGETGVRFDGTSESASSHANFMEMSWVYGPSGVGISIEDYAYDNQFQTVQVALTGSHGIECANGAAFFTDVHIWSAGGDGLWLNGADSTRVVNGHFETNAGAGIRLTSADRVAIAACTIRTNGDSGLTVEGGHGVMVSACELRDNTGPGILLEDHLEGSIIGNICRDIQGTKTQTYGIVVTGTADYLSIVGNQSRAELHTTGAISLPTAATHITQSSNVESLTGTAQVLVRKFSQQAEGMIDGSAGQYRTLSFNSSGVSRWLVRVSSAAESGSDAGSNFEIGSRTDAGGFKATPFSIARATGMVTLSAGLTMSDATDLVVGTATGTRIGTSSSAKLGFYGVTPATRPTAYTQTYSTADKTHAARTAAALTDSTGGSVGTTIAAITDPADTPASADALRDDLVANALPAIRNAIASLADQVNKLRTDSVDTASALNSVIDDLQTLGLLQ